MKPALTQFGEKMSHLTGVRAIMRDVTAVSETDSGHSLINLSTGNPVLLPAVEQLWRDCTADLLASSDYGEVICRYGASRGYEPLIEAICQDFNQRYGLNLSDRNVLITPGSQSLYFFAANTFGGYTSSGELRKIVLPCSPEYTGYGGACLHQEALVAYKPRVDILGTHRFKYRPDFDHLTIDSHTGFVLFSRPTNPSGNVLTADEVHRIVDLCVPQTVPIFVDAAYGHPFPALTFTETDSSPIFGPNIIHCMSLSKAGLPGERVGIAIGDEEVLQPLEFFQTNCCIHASRFGQAVAARAIASGALAEISERVICPHYRQQFSIFETVLDQVMPQDLPWLLHQGEGAIFAWLWFQDLPIPDWELYQRLKQAGVIVVPGSTFFPGLDATGWDHAQQCIRISLTASCEELVVGAQRLAAVIEAVYSEATTVKSHPYNGPRISSPYGEIRAIA